jgi:hypothetical protein
MKDSQICASRYDVVPLSLHPHRSLLSRTDNNYTHGSGTGSVEAMV